MKKSFKFASQELIRRNRRVLTKLKPGDYIQCHAFGNYFTVKVLELNLVTNKLIVHATPEWDTLAQNLFFWERYYILKKIPKLLGMIEAGE